MGVVEGEDQKEKGPPYAHWQHKSVGQLTLDTAMVPRSNAARAHVMYIEYHNAVTKSNDPFLILILIDQPSYVVPTELELC